MGKTDTGHTKTKSRGKANKNSKKFGKSRK